MTALVAPPPVEGPDYAARLRAHYRGVARRLAGDVKPPAPPAPVAPVAPAAAPVAPAAAPVAPAAPAAPPSAEAPQARGRALWVLRIVAEDYRVEVDDLIAFSRKQTFIEPRHVAIWLVRRITRAKLSTVGRLVGERDFSTVSNSVKYVEIRREREVVFRLRTDRLARRAEAEQP
jgi:hypothetical protein